MSEEKLDRIITKLDAIHSAVGHVNGRLDEHTRQDAEHFAEIENRLGGLVIDDAVSKATAKKAGGVSGRNWAAIVAATAIAVAEAVKAALK